jgi:hypothetical protein
MKNKIITGKDVVFWIGSNATIDDYIEIVSQIANGDYSDKQLKEDIQNHKEWMK